MEILAINPGSTSTKIAWFRDDEEVWGDTIRHDPEDLVKFEHIVDQFCFRFATIKEAVAKHGGVLDSLDAVVGRGGILDPMPGGTYEVDEVLIERAKLGKPWEHASNLGCMLADAFAAPLGIPAFIVDPVSVDEMDPVAKITGLPELPQYCLSHALNIKATVRRAASDLGGDWRKLNFVVAHLGGGLSICAHERGRIIDFCSGNDVGPFSPERTGGLPVGPLVRKCFSGELSQKDMLGRLVGRGGVVAYLGTSDMREVKRRIDSGDAKAEIVVRAMAFQIAKAIGAFAAYMAGNVDAILITGGVAHYSELVAMIQERVQWIAPVLRYPGEDEMSNLAAGALRVLRKEEKPKRYEDYRKVE